MKRDLSKLTEKNLVGIYNWLQIEQAKQDTRCPFLREDHRCRNCDAIFPSRTPKQSECPCHKFNITYVRRIAKQILLEKNFIPK